MHVFKSLNVTFKATAVHHTKVCSSSYSDGEQWNKNAVKHFFERKCDQHKGQNNYWNRLQSMSTIQKSYTAFQPGRNSYTLACVSVLKLNVEINKLTLLLYIWRSHTLTLARSYPDRLFCGFIHKFQQKINTSRNIRKYPCRNLKHRLHTKNLTKVKVKVTL